MDHSHPRTAGLPSSNPTCSFWIHSSPDANPLAREGSEGPLTTDADICIIGSGITGVGVAYHLSEAASSLGPSVKLKVVILEARDFCSGASGRNGGHLTPTAFSGFANRAKRFGLEEAKRSYALERYTVSSLVNIIEEHGWENDVDLVNGGFISLRATEEEMEQAQLDYKVAQNAGWNLDGVTFLDKQVMQQTFGAHHPGVGIPGYNVWPSKLVTKLYQQANEREGNNFSLTLHTHTPVISVAKSSTTDTVEGREYVLSTSRGSIACSRVVHATNAYASYLLPFLAGPNGIVPVRGQVLATRASVGMEQMRENAWAANKGYEYWFTRPLKEGEARPLIIFGGGREATDPDFELNVTDDSTTNTKVGKTLREFLPNVFEGTFEHRIEPEMEWTGIMGFTQMGDPFVGLVDALLKGESNDYKNQYIAAGYTGHGMSRAFGCAEVLAQMIISELAGKGWTQPGWFPTRYLTSERYQTCN